jgi:hypothetical protein
MLVLGAHAIADLDAARIGRGLAGPISRLMLMIGVGLAVGQIIEAAGWTRKLGALGAPLFRFARLGPHCSAAFTTAFFSGEAANAMLFGYWQEGRIDRHQLIMTNLANQLPAFFLHLPTTVFIVLPLTGWAGGLYFIINFLAALLRLIVVVLVARRSRSVAASQNHPESSTAPRPPRRAAFFWTTLKQKLPGRLIGVATYVIPIYVAVFLLNQAGFFEWTQQWLARGFAARFMPIEAFSMVVLSFTAEFTSGFAAAGALMQEGVLSTKQIVLALLIGNVVAFPMRALRHQLPRLIGIFAPKMGMTLLLIGQATRIVSLLMVGSVYYFLF